MYINLLDNHKSDVLASVMLQLAMMTLIVANSFNSKSFLY